MLGGLFWMLIAISALIIAGGGFAFGGKVRRRREQKRGWRVGIPTIDMLFYEELVDGTWRRIDDIGAEIQIGVDTRRFISVRRPDQWVLYPEWARHRRDEIIARLKSDFPPPGFKYEGDG